ncbi:Neutral zinc metallopeptidase [Phytophthora cinnamomi]|uniref:Neutral zinc metallopeptidase n=1 Tax=Phytophthora cinnamomi TaxID=4785 RepID=UPI0035596AAF|nr:Neutral zinc metallopeptidase [Phytophthora cinnamomi]
MSQRFHATYWRSSIAIGPSAPTRDANWNVMDDKNWIMDHIVKNKGLLNYCVRWDSTEKLSKATASKSRSNRCRRCSRGVVTAAGAVGGRLGRIRSFLCDWLYRRS